MIYSWLPIFLAVVSMPIYHQHLMFQGIGQTVPVQGLLVTNHYLLKDMDPVQNPCKLYKIRVLKATFRIQRQKHFEYCKPIKISWILNLRLAFSSQILGNFVLLFSNTLWVQYEKVKVLLYSHQFIFELYFYFENYRLVYSKYFEYIIGVRFFFEKFLNIHHTTSDSSFKTR